MKADRPGYTRTGRKTRIRPLLNRIRLVTLLVASLVCGICASLLVGQRAQAGVVSLETNEILQLRNLIANDEQAAKQFTEILKIADFALGKNPNPIEVVVSEGHLQDDPDKIRTVASLMDMNIMESLAWAWAATGDIRYSKKTKEYILAWAKVNHSDGDAINESKFEPLIVSYDLLRGQFADSEKKLVDGWLKTKAETVWKDRRGLVGNWNSHRIKTVGLIGFVLDDPVLLGLSLDGFRKQMDNGFTADGGCIDFETRDALHYHLYSVEPMLAFARAANRHGDQTFIWQTTNGVSLKKAVEFVVPFAEGTKTHIEFANSKDPFDHQRASNGESEYAAHVWNPKAATRMFSLAAWFDPRYGKLAAKLAGKPDDTLFDWTMVVNKASQSAHADKQVLTSDKKKS